jgi:hypothetical protein
MEIFWLKNSGTTLYLISPFHLVIRNSNPSLATRTRYLRTLKRLLSDTDLILFTTVALPENRVGYVSWEKKLF